VKYGWEICDEVQRFVGNASETQFVSKAEYDKLEEKMNAWKTVAENRQIIISKMHSRLLHLGVNFDFQKALEEDIP